VSEINPFAVAVAALATFVIGGPWYRILGERWHREMGGKKAPGHPAKVFGLAYVFSVISAALLAAYLGPDVSAVTGAKTGALIGACFVAASFGVNYLFANRSFAALAIDGGYHILQFAAFGLILALWP
jgi:Protein of unknown function (DUF1761)